MKEGREAASDKYGALCWVGPWGGEEGDIETADAHADAASELVEQLRQPVITWEFHFAHILQALFAGRLADAGQLIENLRAAAKAAGIPRPAAEASTASGLFVLRYEQGRLTEIPEEVERAARASGAPAD